MNTSLPFPLGKTYFQGETVDTNVHNLLGWVGQSYLVHTGLDGKTLTTVIAVKNGSGITIPKGTPVQLDAGLNEIVGVAAGYNQQCGVVDYTLNSTGCRANDYCYVAVKGPFKALTPDAMAAGTHWTSGDRLTAKTLAASTVAVSAGIIGRVAATDAAHGVALIDGTIGRAAEAATTGETATLKQLVLEVKFG
jgi:hypothetical protein